MAFGGETPASDPWLPPGVAKRLSFFLMVPLLWSCYSGLNFVYLQGGLPAHVRVFVFFTYALPMWLCMAGCTFVVHRMVGRRSFPLLFTTALGGVLGSFVVRPYMLLRAPYVVPYISTPTETLVSAPLIPHKLEHFVSVFTLYHPTIILWTVLAWICIRHFGVPFALDGQGGGSAKSSTGSPSRDNGEHSVASHTRLIDELGRIPHDYILAIRAENHYVRILTTRGSRLLAYRFKDAIREFAQFGGVQVHRSFCVLPKSVLRCEKVGDRRVLVLKDERRVPVSRSYFGVARMANLID